jgi:NAD(P)-dependent dehydrogenase (short-subunit alcohol dehydrogenase family)
VPQDLDLSSQASVRAFVAEAGADVGALDVVIANAGVGFVPGKLKTAQGLDLAFGVNHLGHFTLLQVLHPPPSQFKGSGPQCVHSRLMWVVGCTLGTDVLSDGRAARAPHRGCGF